MANTTLTAQEIVARANGKPQMLTPYQIHKLVNVALAEAGVAKTIRPQMMYTYDSNGMIVKGIKGTREYTLEQAQAFVIRYVAKQVAKHNVQVPVTVTEDTEEKMVSDDQMVLDI